jgi:hypothetical protein
MLQTEDSYACKKTPHHSPQFSGNFTLFMIIRWLLYHFCVSISFFRGRSGEQFLSYVCVTVVLWWWQCQAISGEYGDMGVKGMGCRQHLALCDWSYLCVVLVIKFRVLLLGVLSPVVVHGAESFLRSWSFLRYSRKFLHFMAPEGLLLCSQEPTSFPYPESD